MAEFILYSIAVFLVTILLLVIVMKSFFYILGNEK